MNKNGMSGLTDRLSVVGFLLALLIITSTDALAGVNGRHQPVWLPPGVTVLLPHQGAYSLRSAAKVTASFNSLGATEAGRTANQYPKNLPFQLLYEPPKDEKNNTGGEGTTFYVKAGTPVYVPVLFNTNSLPVLGNFPPAGDRAALIKYFYSRNELGLVYARIAVGGKVTTLGPLYLVELEFDTPLPDTSTLYQTIAAFLSPLKRGVHTVEISALLAGKALSVPPFDEAFPGGVFSFSTTYKVVVH